MNSFPAKSLSSDARLRFRMSVFGRGSRNVGVISSTEPENGIHPLRIRRFWNYGRILHGPTTTRNCRRTPILRQVIVTTHFLAWWGELDDTDLLIARWRTPSARGYRAQSKTLRSDVSTKPGECKKFPDAKHYNPRVNFWQSSAIFPDDDADRGNFTGAPKRGGKSQRRTLQLRRMQSATES